MEVKGFGSGGSGRLGSGGFSNIGDGSNEMGNYLPFINVDTTFDVININAGWEHTCVILESFDIKCWGGGGQGALGFHIFFDIF